MWCGEPASEGSFMKQTVQSLSCLSCSPCPGSISQNRKGGWQDPGTAPAGWAAPSLTSFSWQQRYEARREAGSPFLGRCSFMH